MTMIERVGMDERSRRCGGFSLSSLELELCRVDGAVVEPKRELPAAAGPRTLGLPVEVVLAAAAVVAKPPRVDRLERSARQPRAAGRFGAVHCHHRVLALVATQPELHLHRVARIRGAHP